MARKKNPLQRLHPLLWKLLLQRLHQLPSQQPLLLPMLQLLLLPHLLMQLLQPLTLPRLLLTLLLQPLPALPQPSN